MKRLSSLKALAFVIVATTTTSQALAQNLNSSTPSLGFNNKTSLGYALAQGPSRSLYAYWQRANGTWDGPWGLNNGVANLCVGAPATATNPLTGLGVGAFRGVNNGLYFTRQRANGTWTTPVVAPGSVWMCQGDPTVIMNTNTGRANIETPGPDGSIYHYGELPNGTIDGPLGVANGAAGMCVGRIAGVFNKNTGYLTLTSRGPDNNAYAFWQAKVGTTVKWFGPLEIALPGMVFSNPAMTINPVAKRLTVAVQGPRHMLDIYSAVGATWNSGPLHLNGGLENVCFSDPAMDMNRVTGRSTVVVVGPSNSLRAYWQLAFPAWDGPLGLNGGKANMAFSSPSMVFNGQIANVLAVGPSHNLWSFWQTKVNGQWLGPLGVSGLNTAY